MLLKKGVGQFPPLYKKFLIKIMPNRQLLLGWGMQPVRPY